MINITFLHVQDQWEKMCLEVPRKGDIVTFAAFDDPNFTDYQVSAVHWFDKGNYMAPMISLVLLGSE